MVTTAVALGVVVVSLAAFAAMGTWYSRGRVGSVEDFVVARGTVGGWRLTATLVASGMGAWILFSPAEAGAAFGGVSAVLGYALGSAAPMLAYAVLGPRVRELLPGGHSLTEYAHVRYGTATYALVLVVSAGYMFVFLAAELTGVADALALVAGVPAWQTAVLVGGFVLLYTGYGGLTASVFTDAVQAVVLLPLLAVGFAGATLALGGPASLSRRVAAGRPELLDPGFLPGVEFGVYVAIAILGAELLNQAWWQRIYAARDDRTLRRSFGATALLVVPMVLVPGLFGVAGAGLGLVGDGEASVAFFVVLRAAAPDWVSLVVVLVALLLVVSTADSLFNALSSLVTTDLGRLVAADDATLLSVARGLTAAVAVAAAAVAARGYSVLTLFLTADLLAAATFPPLVAGLYARRTTGAGALAGALVGLGLGAALFPPFRAAVPGPAWLPAASFLGSFAGAALGSGVVTAAATAASGSRTDLDALDGRVHRLDARPGEADTNAGDPPGEAP